MQKLQIKEEIMAVAALLALGMLAIMPGLIAGSALTTSTKQVPNVVTQVSVAYCGYKSGWFNDWGKFADCMMDLWFPKIPVAIASAVGAGAGLVQIGKTVGSWALINAGVRIAGFAGIWGWGIAAL